MSADIKSATTRYYLEDHLNDSVDISNIDLTFISLIIRYAILNDRLNPPTYFHFVVPFAFEAIDISSIVSEVLGLLGPHKLLESWRGHGLRPFQWQPKSAVPHKR